MDIFGPVDTESLIAKSRYGIVFIDEYTQFRSIRFMSYKSQTLAMFMDYVAEMNTLLRGRYKVRGVHSDNGGELISRAFMRYCS
jgi:hypothetical protein